MKMNKLFLTAMAATLLFFSCKTIEKTTRVPFQIKDASYYSWFLDENERGTNISIELSAFPSDIIFDAVVFNGIKLPLAVAKDTNKYILNAVQTTASSVLKTEQEVVNGKDRLIYTQNGKQQSVLIEKFRREKMQYYYQK